MTEEQAREILDARNAIGNDDGLLNGGWYLVWSRGDKEACLDGDFTADELEAIAWWMRHSPFTKPGA